MVKTLDKKNIATVKLVRKRKTIAFKGACFLIALLLWSFYRDVIFPVADRASYSVISILIIMYVPKIIVTFYLGYELIRKYENRPLNNAFILLVIFLLTVFLSYMMTRSGVTKMLDLLLVLVGLLFFNNFSFDKKEIKKIIWLLIISTGLILLHASPIDDYTLGSEKFNPNEAAYCLTMLFCVLITFFAKYKKVLYLLLAVACVGLQFVYGSRTSFFGLLLFCVLFVLLRARKKTFGFNTVFIAVVVLALFSVIFAYYYSVVLFEKFGKHTIFIFGKDLFTGRETIWQLAFESIENNLWFGVGSHMNEEYYTAGSVIMNAHNQSIGVLGAFGVLVFISFYWALAYIVADRYKRKSKNRVPAIFFILVILMSYLDLHLFQSKNYSIMLLAYAVISGLSDYVRVGGKKWKKAL